MILRERPHDKPHASIVCCGPLSGKSTNGYPVLVKPSYTPSPSLSAPLSPSTASSRSATQRLRHKALPALAVLLLLPAALAPGAGAQAAATAANAALPAQPPARTVFFPLSQIRRGQQGVAYTVFSGTTPQPMGVEVLGLLDNARGPNQPMILVRLEGKEADYTGVVEGMSGSPVYIDGKLVGALAYRIGQFSKEPIAGVTPIAQMLAIASQPATTGSPNSATLPDAMQPIETPIYFSGFSPAALAFWKEQARARGLGAEWVDVSSLGGSDTQAANAQNAIAPQQAAQTDHPGQSASPLRPGDAVSALMVSGDLSMSATCTVTYVAENHMLACGHPLSQYGAVSMPMTKAEVLATLPSPMNSFKIINTTQTIGAITEDRESGILGVFGQKARMIPVAISIAGAHQATETLHLGVMDQPQMTPMAVMVSVFQALLDQNSYSSLDSYQITGSIALAGYPAVHLDTMIAPQEGAPANLLAALLVGSRFDRLYSNAARRAPIERVTLHFEQFPARLITELLSVRTDHTRVHAGDTITLDASLLPLHGEVQNLRIPITLPVTLPPGPVRLMVSNGPALDRLLHPGGSDAGTPSVAATIAQMNSEHPSNRLYVTLLAPQVEATLDGQTLTALPLSMANVLAPLRQSHDLTLHGESAIPLASRPLGAVLEGQQGVWLTIEN